MSKPTTYVVETEAVNSFAVVRVGSRGGRTVMGFYKSETIAQELVRMLNLAEWNRWH